jgi:uncharacterized protein YceK
MKKILAIILVLSLLLLAGCTTPIKEIKANPDKYMGEKVSVKGTVSNTIKLGSLSGFTLDDGSDKITVSSDTLPKEGATVTVDGVVMKELFLGTYVQAKSVN